MGKLILRKNGFETQFINGEDFSTIVPQADTYVLGFDAVSGNLEGLDPNGNIISYGNGDSSFTGNTIDITYSGLTALIDTNGLSAGSYYLISDFRTVYDVPDFFINGNSKQNILNNVCSIEPIIVLATSEYTIAPDAYQPDYPSDKIKYDYTWASTEINNVPTYGRISERIDEWNNRTDYDHRNAEFIRYQTYNFGDKLTGKIDSYDCTNGTVTGTDTLFLTEVNPGDILLFDTQSSFLGYQVGVKVISADTDTVMSVVVDSGYTSTYFESTLFDFYLGDSTSNNYDYKEVYVGQFNSLDYERHYTFQLNGNSLSNYIGDYCKFYLEDNYSNSGFLLPNNTFGNNSYSNTLGDRCYNNATANWFTRNTIEGRFYNNSIRSGLYSNTISQYFNNNIIKSSVYENVIGNGFQSNTITNNFYKNEIGPDFYNNDINGETYNNRIGERFEENTIYGPFYDNQIFNEFKGNITYQDFSENRLDWGFGANEFSGNCFGNTFGRYISSNDFLGDVYSNTFKGGVLGNTIGNNFANNNIGVDFTNNVIGENFGNGYGEPQGNTIGNNFHDNTIGEYFYNNTIADNFSDNEVGNYFQWNVVNTNIDNTDFTINYGNVTAFTYTPTATGATNNIYLGVSGTTSGTGVNATFDIEVLGGDVVGVSGNSQGQQYIVNDTITISGYDYGTTQITVTGISVNPSVYETYNCQIFERQGGDNRLSYYDSLDTLIITNINE